MVLRVWEKSRCKSEDQYLIGIMYHEHKPYDLWTRGIIEDYESTSGVYIQAASIEEALNWAEDIGQRVLDELNPGSDLDWKGMGYQAWHVKEPSKSNWAHCLGSFPKVKIGEYPDVFKF